MVAKKTAEVVSVVDQMADDATPQEYPDGAPKFVEPISRIRPRSRRAAFKRKMGELEPLKDRVQELQASGVFSEDTEGVTEHARINAAADMDDMFQLMDDLLTLAAVDEQAYREWSDQVDDDNELIQVFNVYINRGQPGEASSSTS
jgi:hypothetical protein